MSETHATSPVVPSMGDSTTLNPLSATSQPQVVTTPWVMSLFIFCYSLIFLLGLTGNCLVAFVVMRNKAMQTITNIFITNLAISDILMCLLAVPFTPIAFFLNSWIFGKALCHIVPMILCISVYVSTLTSTAIAVDRYFVIVYPFKPRMKVYMCVLMIFAIWIISISISLPLGIYHEVEKTNGSYSCSEQWPKPQARQFFTVTSLVLQYIVPCSIISFCYTMVSRALKKRSKVKIGSGARTREREEMEIKRKKRTNKMLIAMQRSSVSLLFAVLLKRCGPSSPTESPIQFEPHSETVRGEKRTENKTERCLPTSDICKCQKCSG
ncbi:neuropeptide FF receptor 2 [Biomphalaria pfeifferi]|uniref:Neuropeptide FF receptor 2 n=1 Tax=Biomphalaria pfeifferi TaxID=112525 RepID=A0AAD8FDT8_BIOPF|nr:neuropeptide FF receptor 2 [Biomphalaria pfeifferi]